MAKHKCKPLRVTIWLRDGRFVSTDGIIMLDAILYHAWFWKHAPHVLRGEADNTYDGNIGLPLRQLGGNRWAASKGVYEELSQNVEYYNKRPDFFAADKIGYLSQNSGIIDDSAGPYRAYRNPIITRTIKDGRIDFWCIGHADEIADLLNRMPAVGKKPSMGFGVIDRFAIAPADDDYSLWHPDHGLMRPVPVEEGTEECKKYPLFRYGCKPPYWKQCNARVCYVPIK